MFFFVIPIYKLFYFLWLPTTFSNSLFIFAYFYCIVWSVDYFVRKILLTFRNIFRFFISRGQKKIFKLFPIGENWALKIILTSFFVPINKPTTPTKKATSVLEIAILKIYLIRDCTRSHCGARLALRVFASQSFPQKLASNFCGRTQGFSSLLREKNRNP